MRTHPDEPGSGGVTRSASCLPLATTLIANVPAADFLMSSDRMAPADPFASLYLKAVAPVFQKGLPVAGSVPPGRTNAWLADVAPKANTVTVAPVRSGDPASASGLAFSFAVATRERFEASSDGFGSLIR